MKSSLEEIADGCFAYLQLPGSWGYSNSGLVVDGEQSLVVDTLYDARLAAEMIESYRKVATKARLETVVNTHANGDHCWGNQMFKSASIIATSAAAREMQDITPGFMHTVVKACRVVSGLGRPAKAALGLLGRVGLTKAGHLAEAAPFFAEKFGAFEFGSVELTLPTRTFDRELDLQVGDKTVHLIEVGPAHTRGDMLVHVPSDRVVFTGDILFEEAHPIMWEGPIQNWIDACNRILAMDVETVVPGHGRLATPTSIERLRRYLVDLEAGARQAYDGGVSVHEAAHELRKTLEPQWDESERLAANVAMLYQQFAGESEPVDAFEMFAKMAKLGAV